MESYHLQQPRWDCRATVALREMPNKKRQIAQILTHLVKLEKHEVEECLLEERKGEPFFLKVRVFKD